MLLKPVSIRTMLRSRSTLGGVGCLLALSAALASAGCSSNKETTVPFACGPTTLLDPRCVDGGGSGSPDADATDGSGDATGGGSGEGSGEGSGDGSGTSEPTVDPAVEAARLDNLCTQLVTTLCSTIFRCFTPEQLLQLQTEQGIGDEAGCVANGLGFADRCLAPRADIAAGFSLLTDASDAACRASFAGLDCANFVEAPLDACFPPPTGPAVRTGGACRTTVDCAAPEDACVMAEDEASSEATCRPMLGVACTTAEQCGRGQFCDLGPTNYVPAEGATGACADRLDEGAPCFDRNACVAPLACTQPTTNADGNLEGVCGAAG
jgi:hypothetical protein